MGNGQKDPRKAVEGKLGYPVYDCVWERVFNDLGAEDGPGHLQDLAELAEDLQGFADEVVREFQNKAIVRRRWSKDSVRYNDDSERDFSSILLKDSFRIDSDSSAALRALSAYTYMKASNDPRVTEFRVRVLGTGLMSKEQATDLLLSHAARFLTFEQMQNLEIPFVGHETSLLGPYAETNTEEHFDHAVLLRVEPPGISLSLRYTNALDGSDTVEGIVRHEVENGRAVAPYKILFPPEEVPGIGLEDSDREIGPGKRRVGSIQIGGFDTALRPANVWPGSVVDEIHCLAEELSESYMWPSRATRGRVGNWWDADSVALFLLAGMAPFVHPIKVRSPPGMGGPDTPTRVVLEVLPWIGPESVVDSFAFAKRVLDVNLRNQGGRKFDLVTFVLRREESCDPDTLDFRRLREDWNTEFPNRKFRDASMVKTYFRRGLEAVQQRYHS